MDKKVMIIVGTRPNFIKITQFQKEFEAYGDEFEYILVHNSKSLSKAVIQHINKKHLFIFEFFIQLLMFVWLILLATLLWKVSCLFSTVLHNYLQPNAVVCNLCYLKGE